MRTKIKAAVLLEDYETAATVKDELDLFLEYVESVRTLERLADMEKSILGAVNTEASEISARLALLEEPLMGAVSEASTQERLKNLEDIMGGN